jgi:hypothetical protein
MGIYLPSRLLINTTPIAQLKTLREMRNAQTIKHAHGGAVNPRHASIRSESPAFEWSGTGLKMALDTIGLGAYDVATGAGFKTWLQEGDAGGTRLGAASHEQLAASKGLAILGDIAAEANDADPATVSGMIYCDSSDGTTDPVTRTADQSIDATAFTHNVYGAGKVVLNGTELAGLLGHSFSFGHQVTRTRDDGDYYPTATTLLRTAGMTLTVRCRDIPTLRASLGVSGSISSLVWYYRHMAEGGTWTADGTASHIKMTGYEGTWHLSEQSVDDDAEDGEGTFVIELVDDGSSGILAVDTAVAIT